jgi:kynurenine formamidase
MRGQRAAGAVAVVALAVAAYVVGASQPGGSDAGTARAATPPATAVPVAAAPSATDLWRVYQDTLRKARYIDLTHDVAPTIPVWKGFGASKFKQSVNPETGQPYTYEKDGFVATGYDLATDQFGTQFDPPAHWDPNYPALDEVPATFAVRPLVVISIVAQVKRDPKYALQVADIRAFERRHGTLPAGSVVMVRSDWSKKWTEDPVKAKALAADPVFPGVSLDAIKFLHLKRHILFHGHEPLDTDTTPTLEGEAWLMHHGYTQAEGVDNLDAVPATGCLLSIGYPKFKGGAGGYARYIAICPPGTQQGVRISSRDAPLPRIAKPLHWDEQRGYRLR